MRRLRLLFYTDSTGYGGAEAALKHLVQELSARHVVCVLGVEPRVVAAIAGSSARALVRRVPKHKLDAAAIVGHIGAIRDFAPDVLQANLISPWSCQYALAIAPVLRIPSVAVYQLPNAPVNQRQVILKRMTAGVTTAHVAVGQATAREIERLVGLRAGSVRTIYNGVPDDGPSPSPSDPGRPFTVGTVARLAPQKGVDVLVQALAQLPDSRLTIIGDGEERPPLERIASDLGIATRVLFRGWVDDPRPLLGDVDVFVLPSRFEGFPLSILEAQLACIPVVASDVGSVHEAVVPGSTGLLVPPDDPDELARALRILQDDAPLRRALAVAGRERVLHHFTSRHMAQGFELLYAELVT